MMNTTNEGTNVAVRSKDIRQAAIRRYLNYQMAIKARESMVEMKNDNNDEVLNHELKDYEHWSQQVVQ